MKIEVNLRKRYFLSIIGAILILAGIFGAYAALSDSAPNPGHTASQIAGFPDCTATQVLRHNQGVWSCIELPSVSTTTNDYIIDNMMEFSSAANLAKTEFFNYQNIDGDTFGYSSKLTGNHFGVLILGRGWTKVRDFSNTYAGGTDITLTNVDQDFDVEIMVKLTYATRNSYFGFRSGRDATTSSHLIEFRNAAGLWKGCVKKSGEAIETVTSGGVSINVAQWYKLRIVKEGTTVTFYVDDNSIGSLPFTSLSGTMYLSFRTTDADDTDPAVDYLKYKSSTLSADVFER